MTTNRRAFLKNSAALLAVPTLWTKPKQPRLVFSTLGCPDWSWQTIVDNAALWGYTGIEVRGIGKEMDLTACAEFTGNRLSTSIQMVKDKGLKIINLGASTNLHIQEPVKRQQNIDEAKRYIDLAQKLDCGFVRVFPNKLPAEVSKQSTIDAITKGLIELGAYAKGSGVKVLMETHGDVVQTDDLIQIMKEAHGPQTGLIWDFFNMYVVTRQNPVDMYHQIGQYIDYVHLKDAIFLPDNKHQYVMAGKGQAPLREVLALLKAKKYKGYYGFEWEKRWHPEIEAPELAFPAFAEWMKTV